ncbi:MAG: RluA family pseudouridine synthase [Rhodospirillales bacterium]|nr:RluA family pseudouridine synthase [Rhodospirillales bacterium]
MGHVQTVTVSADEADLRLDRWFRRHYPQVPHGRLQKWLRGGQVRIDGRRAEAGSRLDPGQCIRVPPLGDDRPPPPAKAAPPPVASADANELLRRVLYRDDHLIVLDKPFGLAVQGGTRTHRHLDAMLDVLRFGGERPRLVHRLDRDTSGALVLGRTAAAAAALTKAFKSKTAQKRYWAVVVGVPAYPQGRIDVALAKVLGRGGERVQADAEHGRPAITDYRIIAKAGREAAWLELEPVTGRTHQLRVHCAAMGTPILGDGKYGGAAAFPGSQWSGSRLHLHARAIVIPHPAGGTLDAEAPLPDDLKTTWRFFGFSETDGDDLRPRPGGCASIR